jgi:hypothetical protein
MKTKENVTIYKCDFCNKFLQKKHAMEAHEKKCTKNPENINFCEGCKYLERIDSSYIIESNGCFGYSEREVKCNGFKCNKLDKEMYPRKVISKGFLEKYPESYSDKSPMPNYIDGCEHFDLGLFD